VLGSRVPRTKVAQVIVIRTVGLNATFRAKAAEFTKHASNIDWGRSPDIQDCPALLIQQ
jgi:hypothetical protein